MRDPINAGDVEVSVGSTEAAAKLRDDFEDLTQRVNLDLTNQRFNPADPVSVEMAIDQAERSIDFHLRSFPDNEVLQSLATEIKQKFRSGIMAQAVFRRE